MVRFLLIFLLMISSFLLAQCQRAKLGTTNDPTDDNIKSGIESCSISQAKDNNSLALITCPDGSSLSIPKVSNGSNGIDGINGTSCSVETSVGGAMIICADGSQAFVKNGDNGHSCSVSSINAYSSLIACTDGSQSLIDLNSMVQHSLKELIDPCGDDPDNFDEVLMKFNNGDILTYFQSGSKRFLSLLAPGTYQTTDAQQCKFSVDSQGTVADL